MKTALTPKQYLSDEGYGTGTNYTTGLVVELMKGYHASQLEEGIKAKALRRKGTDVYYYWDNLYMTWGVIDAPIPVEKQHLQMTLPADAERVDITIIVEDKK